MRVDRTLAVAGKVLCSLRHDRRTVAFILVMPLLMITIFGCAFGGTVKDISVMVVDLDQGTTNGSLALDIVDEIQSRDTLKVVEILGLSSSSDPLAYAREKVSKGEVWGAIVFGSNMTLALNTGQGSFHANLTIVQDASNANLAKAIIEEVQSSVRTVLAGKYHISSPVSVVVDPVYGKGAQFIDSFAPGVMGLAVMMITFMLSIFSFVHERSTGTLDRLLTTPVKESEIVIGNALALALVALIQSSVVIVAAVLIFNVHIVGNVLLVLLLLLLLGIGMQGVGFLLSSNACSEFQALQFMPLILFPSILLAGVFWPLEAIPDFLRPVSYCTPLTYAVDGARSVMIRGWGIEHIWVQLVVLTAFASAMLILSSISLRRRG